MDKNSRLGQFDGALIHWNCLPGFEKVLNVKVDGLADICERLVIRVAPCVAALERWTRGVPGVPAILEFIGLDGHFENVGFHSMPRTAFARHKIESVRLSHAYAKRSGWNCSRHRDIRVSLHSGPHMKKSLFIAIKTSSGFAPHPPRRHIFLEQRAGAILQIAEPLLQHMQ